MEDGLDVFWLLAMKANILLADFAENRLEQHLGIVVVAFAADKREKKFLSSFDVMRALIYRKKRLFPENLIPTLFVQIFKEVY